MIWVIVVAAVAVLALVMAVCYAAWLAHKTSDLFAELKVLGDRVGQLGELMGQIRPPARYAGLAPARMGPNPDNDIE